MMFSHGIHVMGAFWRVLRRGGVYLGGAKTSSTTLLSHMVARWGARGQAIIADSELNYFTERDDESHAVAQRQRAYAAMFPRAECANCTIRFEKTPNYLYTACVPYRMREVYAGGLAGGLKLLVFLRDPVDRAVSHYLMNMDIRVNAGPSSRAQAEKAAGPLLIAAAAALEECYGPGRGQGAGRGLL
mmetsp:Transcript_34639/g.109407  ORF Transcript_34639/g.109407 Transcript_34639/m.109407 type:complete len:187 (-) Transcript_34639:14-574(-)